MSDNLLKCSYPDCESHNSSGLFNINVSVDAWRDVAETLNKIEPEYFACAHCGAEAVEKEVK